MSVRKRIWLTTEGKKRMPELAAAHKLNVKDDRAKLLDMLAAARPEGSLAKVAWIVTYTDREGDRVQETYTRKKDATDRHAEIKVDLGRRRHVARSKSITVEKAGQLWLDAAASRVERATLARYGQHLALHIVPHFGSMKLADLDLAAVDGFKARVSQKPGIGRVTARKIIGSLGAILADALMRGDVSQNVVRDLPKRRNADKAAEERGRGKLEVGVDIPTPAEIKVILATATGRWKPFLLVAVFCGLRASELRGLRWQDVKFDKAAIEIRQRADRYNDIGKPKSAAGRRTVPVPRDVLNVLREWKVACPPGPLDLVFPNGRGKIESHANIVTRGLWPIEIAAGVCTIAKDADGKVIHDADGNPVKLAKYTGLHSFRHFFASWCINRRADGGRELPAKVVQTWLGHSTIVLTLDTYGHLFPHDHDADELAAAAATLLG